MKKLATLVLIFASALAQAQTSPMPKPQYTVGDTWTHRVFDLTTQIEQRKLITEVKIISDNDFFILSQNVPGPTQWWRGDNKTNRFEERLYFDSTKPDKPGKSISGSAAITLRWPLKVGDTWNQTFTSVSPSGSLLKYEWTVVVEKEEKITVPAGTFDTLKVVAKGFWSSVDAAGSGRTESTLWVAPNVKREVRYESRFWVHGKIADNTGTELVSWSVKNDAPK